MRVRGGGRGGKRMDEIPKAKEDWGEELTIDR